MQVLVFTHRKNRDAGDALADQLRSEGHAVLRIESKHYKGEALDKIERVMHDGTDSRVLAAHPGVDEINFAAPKKPRRAPRKKPAAPEPTKAPEDAPEAVSDADA